MSTEGTLGHMREGGDQGSFGAPSVSILIVEDNLQLLRAIALKLNRDGHTVWQAESADQALTLLEEKGRPDLILTDVIMPGEMSGLDLLAHAKNTFPSLPVAVMSAFPHANGSSGTGLARADLYLEKPVRLSDLSQRLMRLLDTGSQ